MITIMTVKQGILSQSTAVFPLNQQKMWLTPVMHEKNKYRHIPWNRYNFEKYRDINFWSYRPALVWLQFCESTVYIKIYLHEMKEAEWHADSLSASRWRFKRFLGYRCKQSKLWTLICIIHTCMYVHINSYFSNWKIKKIKIKLL